MALSCTAAIYLPTPLPPPPPFLLQKPEKEEAATGAAFYVHPHGDDSNDGLTVKTPVQSIQLAADRAAASADIKTVSQIK